MPILYLAVHVTAREARTGVVSLGSLALGKTGESWERHARGKVLARGPPSPYCFFRSRGVMGVLAFGMPSLREGNALFSRCKCIFVVAKGAFGIRLV